MPMHSLVVRFCSESIQHAKLYCVLPLAKFRWQLKFKSWWSFSPCKVLIAIKYTKNDDFFPLCKVQITKYYTKGFLTLEKLKLSNKQYQRWWLFLHLRSSSVNLLYQFILPQGSGDNKLYIRWWLHGMMTK